MNDLEHTLLNDIKSFLGDEGMTYMQQYKDDNKVYLAWGSMIGGAVGMQVRNHLKNKYPQILDNFSDYGEFEDYTTKLMLKLLK